MGIGKITKMKNQYLRNPSDSKAQKNFAKVFIFIINQELENIGKTSDAEKVINKEYVKAWIDKKLRRNSKIKFWIFFGIMATLGTSYFSYYKRSKQNAAIENQLDNIAKKTNGLNPRLGTMLDPANYEPRIATMVSQRLSEIKGIDEIIDEINNFIKMIKNPQKYKEKGAKVPKGLILYGKPGTGKTMIARAIAGEAGVTFIYCTASEFEEVFVGVGARRIRKLFEKARERSPCIIFIDEIDTLFTQITAYLRSTRRSRTELSSSRATINEILSQMDGFKPTDNILVIGATNNFDILDPAAIRSGRFDYKIYVPLPDIKGREEIINLYLSKTVHNFGTLYNYHQKLM